DCSTILDVFRGSAVGDWRSITVLPSGTSLDRPVDSGGHRTSPLEPFQRLRTASSTPSERVPRSPQAGPLLPVAARLRHVREPGRPGPLSWRQPGQGNAGPSASRIAIVKIYSR